MKTKSATILTRLFIVLGIFGISAVTTYGAIANGGLLKSTPYRSINATADATLSKLTNGKGGVILDGVVAKVKAKALEKGGSPLDITKYNAYIDNRLDAIDALDNEVQKELGSDYTFLFQYIYPRILELKQQDQTSSILEKIGSIVDSDSSTSNNTVNTGSTNSVATVKDCNFSLKPYFDLGLKTTFYYGANNKMYQPSSTGEMTLPGDMKNQFNVMKAGTTDIEYGFQCQDGVLTVTDKNFSITTALPGTNNQSVGVTTATTNSEVTTNTCWTGKKQRWSMCVTDMDILNPTGNYTVWQWACVSSLGDDVGYNWTGYTISINGQTHGIGKTLNQCLESCDIGDMNIWSKANCFYEGKLIRSGKDGVIINITSSAIIAPDSRKVLTVEEKKVVKDYIIGVLEGTGSEKEKAQTIYNAMIAQGLDPQHIADAIDMSLVDVNAYLAKKDSITISTGSTISAPSADVASASDSVSFSANKTSVNRGETIDFTYAVAGDPVGCKAWYSTTSENQGAEVTFREGNSVSNTMSAAMAKGGTFSITFDKDASGESGVFKDNKSTVLLTCYGTFGGVYQTIKKSIDITVVVGGATLPATVSTQANSTTTTTTSTSKVLTADEKATVKGYIIAVLGGTGTDKEKAQTIYDAMTAYKIDAQNVADAIGYSVADVNAYLAKRQ